MRTTGFRDDNQVEIFDGDIIEYRKLFIYGTNECITRAAQVVWSNHQQDWFADGYRLSDIVKKQMLSLGCGSVGCKVVSSCLGEIHAIT